MNLHLRVTGMPEIKKAMDSLTGNMRGRIARKAITEATEIARAAVAKAAPVGPPKANRKWGPIKQTVRMEKMKRSRKFPGVRMRVIIARDATTGGGVDYKGDTFYAAFVEFGHKIGKRNRSRRARYFGTDNRASVPPHPFVATGWNASKQQAESKVIEVLKSELQKRSALTGSGGEA